MKNHSMKNRHSETGSANTRLIIILIGLFLIAHAGYQYIPVAYQGEYFKQEMQTAVTQGMAVPPGVMPVDLVRGKLQRALVANNIPTDAVVQVKPLNDAVSAHVAYTRQINILPFGIYKYNYRFDNTATPTGFLFKDSASKQ